ncbi:MAG: hypothetical protein K6U80_19780 [Firmicutes bacterium]|nr:hypothetical protein [Bacillota bacterium]
MRKVISFILLLTLWFNFSVSALPKTDLHFKWGIDFYQTHFEEEGFLAPDLFGITINNNLIISDPVKKRVRLVNNDGKILKDFVVKRLPLKLIVTKSGDIFIYTLDKVYILNPTLKLKKEFSHNFFLHSVTSDHLGNQYIYDNYYDGKDLAKIFIMKPEGKSTIFIDLGASTYKYTELVFIEDQNLLALVQENGDTFDVTYFSLEGKQVKKGSLPYAPGYLIYFHKNQFVFWHPEEFKVSIVDETKSQEFDLLAAFKRRNISVNDILSSASGLNYYVRVQDDGTLVVLASTKKELIIFKEKISFL